MLQDANGAIRFSFQLVLIPLGSLTLAGGLLLTSCAGNDGRVDRGNQTRMVEQPYLTASGDPAGDAARDRTGKKTGAESEFARLQRAMLGDGGDVNEGFADASLDEFAGMLDNQLKELQGDAGPASGKEIENSLPGPNEAWNTVKKPDEIEDGEIEARAKVDWQQVHRSGEDSEQPTPADREELIGSANDPARLRTDGKKPDLTALEASFIDSGDEGSRGSNGSGRSTKSFSIDEMVVMLSGKLHRNAAYSSVPLREYIVDASMLALDPSRRIDPQELYNLNERERELLGDLQAFFIEVGKQLRATRDPETIIEAVNKLARGLGSAGNLEIPIFKLCLAVQNFGTYEEVESTTFVRGRPHEVITYIEVANFQPQAASGGDRFKTVLTQEAELYTDADGTIVHRQAAVTAEDYCRNVRRDFFLVRHLRLPANLSVGSYWLKVRVKDEASQQEAEAILPIEIVASLPSP